MFRFRKGPKRASKVQEERLLTNAKKLKEDPLRVVPECGDSCFLCKFSKSKKVIEKIAEKTDDKNYLEKASKRGTDLSMAVAGTILLGDKDKLPALSTTKTPHGDMNYVKMKAKEKTCLGTQYFDDPTLRLFNYYTEAKKGFFIYSWDNRVVCMGKNDTPPEGYVDNRISKSPYRLGKADSIYSCGHTGEKDTRSFLSVNWSGAKLTFQVCSKCARKDTNIFAYLTEGMLSKDNTDSFSVSAKYKMDCKGDCDHCSLDSGIRVPEELKDEWFQGDISDSKFIKKFEGIARSGLNRGRKIFVIGSTCYGSDINHFFSDFDHEEWEKIPIKKAVNKVKHPLIMEQASINELLSKVWNSSGKDIIESIVEDPDICEDMYRELDETDRLPREIIKDAHKKKKTMERLSTIPRFGKLPQEARFAHDLAMVYKAEGEEEIINHIDNLDTGNTRLKALAFAFLAAVGKGESRRWRYDSSEIDTGNFLKEHVERLIGSEGEEYAKALQDLLKMSGSSAEIIQEDD